MHPCQKIGAGACGRPCACWTRGSSSSTRDVQTLDAEIAGRLERPPNAGRFCSRRKSRLLSDGGFSNTWGTHSALFFAGGPVGNLQLVAGDSGVEALQFVEIGEGDANVALAASLDHNHLRGQVSAQVALGLEQLG